jgi:hypothetical protein
MFLCFYTLEQIRDWGLEIILLLCCPKPQDYKIRCHTTDDAQVFD